MDVRSYIKVANLVDYQSSPGLWIHARVVEISADGNSCLLSLFNNKRCNCYVSLTTSDIEPFHTHSLSSGLSDTKYLRYWPFTPELFQQYREQLETISSSGLLVFSAEETAQFFGARLPFLFAHSLAKLSELQGDAMKVGEETMAVLVQFFQSIHQLQASADRPVLESAEAALWTCWPEFMFLLQHLLCAVPGSLALPSDLFDVMVSEYTSAKCPRLCAHFLERFAASGGFNALASSFQPGLPLEVYAAVPLLQLCQKLTQPFKGQFAKKCIDGILLIVEKQSLRDQSVVLLERIVSLAKDARIDCAQSLRNFVDTRQQRLTSPEDFAVFLRATRAIAKATTDKDSPSSLSLTAETQQQMLASDNLEVREALEHYAMDLALTGTLPPHLLQIYAAYSEKFCYRLIITLVKKKNWACLGADFTLPPTLDTTVLVVNSVQQGMPFSLLLLLFPTLSAKAAPRVAEELLLKYADRDCTSVLLRYFQSPQRLMASLRPNLLSSLVSNPEARRKLRYFVFTLQKLLYLWVAQKTARLPDDLVQLVAQEFL